MKTNFELIDEHNKGTRICSLMGHMRQVSPTYNEIIEKGESIVPDILKYLRDNDSGMNIMLLLWDILKVSPYEPETIKNDNGDKVKGFAGFKVPDAREAWLDWGKKKNII